MTTALDTKARAKAQSAIRKFATSNSTLTRKSVTSYDASTGAEVTADVTASVLMSPPSDYRSFEIDGSAIQRGDARIYLAAADLEAATTWTGGEVQAGDVITTTAGKVFRVIAPNPIYSGDLIAVYEMQVRA